MVVFPATVPELGLCSEDLAHRIDLRTGRKKLIWKPGKLVQTAGFAVDPHIPGFSSHMLDFRPAPPAPIGSDPVCGSAAESERPGQAVDLVDDDHIDGFRLDFPKKPFQGRAVH
jgi:hypothetical protein